jgi:hypothetical protein
VMMDYDTDDDEIFLHHEEDEEEPNLVDFWRNGRLNIRAFLGAQQDWEESEEERREQGAGDPSKKKKKTKPFQQRRSFPREDPNTSSWWRRYVLDSLGTWKDLSHPHGKLFMRRFTLPFNAVHEIIAKIREPEHIFWSESADAFGRACAPLELLVLGCYRMLARNSTYDCLAEATYISEDVHRLFAKRFFQWYATVVFPTVCFLPTVEDMKTSSKEYELAAFPSTISSVDVVHTRLWSCASNLKNAATGKEHYPSLGYEVHANHRLDVLACTPGFWGSVGDKSIIRFDGAMTEIRSGKYAAIKSEIYSGVGDEKVVLHDVHTINDNGYHYWRYMMEPSKYSQTDDEAAWSELLESLRKDIERLFAIIKQMFAIIKYGSRMTEKEEVDNLFLACLAIYQQKKNMFHVFGRPWDLQYAAMTADAIDAEGAQHPINRMRMEVTAFGVGRPAGMVVEDGDEADREMGHDQRKNALITHFKVMKSRREIVWPSQFAITYTYFPD